MSSGTRRRCLLSFAAIIFAVLVIVGAYLPISNRAPASVKPAEMSIYPVHIVCAGPATSDGIFQFSAAPGELSVSFDTSGKAVVTGSAQVSLRGHGDDAEFEGTISVRGTRSADGRFYNLEAAQAGQRFLFELNRDGDGKATREIASDRGPVAHKFLSHCQDEL